MLCLSVYSYTLPRLLEFWKLCNSALLSRFQAFFLFFSFMCWDGYMWVVSCGLGSYSESFSRTLLFLFGTYSSLGTLQWNPWIIQLQHGLSLLPFKVLHVVGIPSVILWHASVVVDSIDCLYWQCSVSFGSIWRPLKHEMIEIPCQRELDRAWS